MRVLRLLLVVHVLLTLASALPISISSQISKSAINAEPTLALSAHIPVAGDVDGKKKTSAVIYEYYDDTVLFPKLCDEYCSHTYPIHRSRPDTLEVRRSNS